MCIHCCMYLHSDVHTFSAQTGGGGGWVRGGTPGWSTMRRPSVRKLSHTYIHTYMHACIHSPLELGWRRTWPLFACTPADQPRKKGFACMHTYIFSSEAACIFNSEVYHRRP